jgi:phage baseplate assembly protein W
VPLPKPQFVDISLSFAKNPSTNDVGTIKDLDAIKASLRNILLTRLGERPFEPAFGSKVYDSLFEQIDFITLDAIASSVIDAINLWEPRVQLISVDPIPSPDSNEVEVVIVFNVIGSASLGPQTFNQTLVIAKTP